MYATPLSPRDIALGNLAWMAIRIAMIASVFTLVIVAFGAAHSPLVVLGIPVAVLTGMAFAAPIAAFSATQRNPNRFNVIFRFGITPLFLFSGTFFPIESLPGFLQPIAWLTPVARRRPHEGTGPRHARPASGSDARPRRRSERHRGGGELGHRSHDRASAGAGMTLRVAPPLMFGSRRALRLIERNLYVYRHGWMVIVSGFFEPLFYLLSIGFGLGQLVGSVPGPGGREIPTSCSSRRHSSRAPR